VSDVDFLQPRALWQKWTDDEKEAFVGNLVETLRGVLPRVQKETIGRCFDLMGMTRWLMLVFRHVCEG
jgi:catalase